MSLRRRRVERAQDPHLGLTRVGRRLAGARLVGKPCRSLFGEAPAPLADGGRAQLQMLRDLLARAPLRERQDDTGAGHEPLFGRRGPQPCLERLLVLRADLQHEPTS